MRTLTPSGRWLSASLDESEFFGQWSYICWIRSGRGDVRVHTHPLGSAEVVSAAAGRSGQTTVREASYKGSRLVSLEDTERGGTTLAWQGDFHELSTYVHGTGVAFEGFVGLLLRLDLQDSRDGLVVRAARGTGTTVVHRAAANMVRDIGTMTVRPSEDVDLRATGAGRPVRGGQLWRDDATDADGRITGSVITVVNDSAVTTVSVFDPASPKLRPFAESIDVRLV